MGISGKMMVDYKGKRVKIQERFGNDIEKGPNGPF
jgi:hypothetical protein